MVDLERHPHLKIHGCAHSIAPWELTRGFDSICVTQLIGAPLYFVNRGLYYDFMANTKRSFGITISLMTQIWGPTTIRISGDESVAGQIKQTANGGVQFSFPERMVLIANHQVSPILNHSHWVFHRISLRLYKLYGRIADHGESSDLYRLAVPLVGGICQQSRHARPPVHHSEAITPMDPPYRDRHDVLWLHLHVEKNVNRSAQASTSSHKAQETQA